MRSSTSSFKPADRAPDFRWGRVWVLALLLAFGLAASAEMFWKARGIRPGIVDDIPTWAWQRSHCSDENRQRVVFAGASRIQMAVDFDTFRQAFPQTEPTMLAAFGTSPLAAVQDLASDADFHGLIVCAITAHDFLPGEVPSQADHVAAHDRAFAWTHLDAAIRSWVQSELVIAGPNGALVNALQSIVQHRGLPREYYARFRRDRTCNGDFTLVDAEQLRRQKAIRQAQMLSKVPPVSPEKWEAILGEVRGWIAELRQHGGDIVFVRMPSTGAFWDADEAAFPRARYWDRIARITGAKTLHFRDVPAIVGLHCPDASHIDYRDKPRFTRAFCERLAAMGLLPR